MNSTNMPFSLIRQQLFEHYGWEFDSLTDRMLDTALGLLAIELQLTKTDVIKQLPNNSQIREKLLDHLVIPETSFFRYPESFAFLKSIVHKWFLKNKGKKIRIASIPCATGEEPYSIAMSLLDAGINFEQFEIDALDISLPLIQKAQLGIYSTNKSIQYTQLLNSKYVDKHPAGLQIKTNIRKHINFIHGNITQMPATFLKKI
ncbi:CheR family methyltransferase [Psychromonas sp. KJ10-10]|uniref:CheR family methyltransferase n=1 Tax=Psychromonas sp. KJ10-10 TaxID=3391823 RepID=UPI0039B6142F